MSRVLNSGELDLSHWRYASLEMEECLKEIIKKKSIQKDDIPNGIYNDLSKFFSDTLEAMKNTKSENPLGQIANYRFAANAIRKSGPSVSGREELNKSLINYAKLFERLSEERRLEEDDVKSIEGLVKFFHQIFLNSDSKTYQKAVSSFLSH